MIIRVNEWVTDLKLLSKTEKFYPQAAYCSFTSGFRQKFNYVIRTTPNISHLLQPNENVIWQEFATSLFEGKICKDEKRQLLCLSVKLSGMGITNITSILDIEYQSCKKTKKAWWIKSKIRKTEAALALKTAATNKKRFNQILWQPSQKPSKQNDTRTIKSQWHSKVRRCVNMVIIFNIKTWKDSH